MCVYLGMRVSRARYNELMALEKELKDLRLNRPMQKGYDYKDWPIIKPAANGSDLIIKNVHWEYIPESVFDENALREARKNFMWLNAKGENLFKNEKGRPSMWKDGALYGRCLVPTTHFFEFRHVPIIGKKGQVLKQTKKVPYCITLNEKFDLFYIAGISRVWTNESRGESADTFAIVTTAANDLMQKVHNSKKRMPTILPQALAEEWLQPGLTEERITEIATYQFPATEMEAWPVENFLTSLPEDPCKETTDAEIPELV
jgi:putative SOS response-associated peptidase YedK